MLKTRNWTEMSLSKSVRVSRRQESITRNLNDKGVYFVQRHNYKRSFGRGRRNFGKVNLKVDATLYLSVDKPPERDCHSIALLKLKENLNDLAKSEKGCVIWYSLEYFEKSDKVVPYVDILLGMCLNNVFIMETTTQNFVMLSNMETYGEKIKVTMFNSLKHIHEDLITFGHSDKSENNPQLFLRYYNHNIATRYYEFVSLLYFRFRLHLDCYRRYKSLAGPALSALNYLLSVGNIESLVLLTKLIQLNLHSLCQWFHEEVNVLIENIIAAWSRYKTSNQVKCFWLAGMLDIIDNGPILGRTLYDRYSALLGAEWAEHVVYPPVQVLQRPNEYLIAEKLDRFHINEDDIIRNMYVYLP